MLICDICQQEFKHQGALTFHKRIRHEGKEYPQLWKKGHPAWSKGLKGVHFSPATEFKKGEISGSNHPKWKGGRVQGKDGYVLVYLPGHHRISHSNYVYEHIVIWEQSHQETLPDDYAVHHINGIKNDNRPENLLAMPIKGHSPTILLREAQRKIRELESKLEGGDIKNGG